VDGSRREGVLERERSNNSGEELASCSDGWTDGRTGTTGRPDGDERSQLGEGDYRTAGLPVRHVT
jgi:hypothetical protein